MCVGYNGVIPIWLSDLVLHILLKTNLSTPSVLPHQVVLRITDNKFNILKIGIRIAPFIPAYAALKNRCVINETHTRDEFRLS